MTMSGSGWDGVWRSSFAQVGAAVVFGLVVSLLGPSVIGALGTESTPSEVCNVAGSTGVSGTVTESGSGSPVAGAWVAVLRTSDFSIAGGGIANGSGDFAAGVPAGSYYLYVIDPVGAHTAGFHGPPTTVAVTAGNTVDADPVMASTRGLVTATVTETGTGTPIAGVWGVALSASAANTGATEAAVAANGSGQLTLPGLRAGNHFVGYIDPTGAHGTRFFPNSPTVPGATPVAVTAGNASAANASLPAQTLVGTGSTITGTVTEQGTNTPLANGRVLALRAADYQIVRAAATNASGQYSLDLAAGAYKLAFLDATGLHDMEWYDNLPSTGLASAVSVTAPGVANGALNANTGTMAGTITDDTTTAPIGCAWVIAIGPTGIAGGAVTNPDGTYTIAGLAPGTYRATFVDPVGGRTQEYWNNSPTYPGATTFNVTAASVATISAALGYTPPPNDAFANAQVITGATGTVSGTNRGATKETGEPNHGGYTGGRSVWYRWTAPSTGTFRFDTCSSNFGTVLAAYTGTTVNALTAIDGNQGGCGDGGSEVSFPATTGVTYRIAVDGYDAAQTGVLALSWAPIAPPPSFLSAWGESLGGGQFDNPYGTAVDSSGNVYVADVGNNRVQKFTSTGTFITEWGTLGHGNGQFDAPWGIAVDQSSGNVYVSELWNSRVQKFSSTGTYLAQFGTYGDGNGQFHRPRGVAVDASGNVYVADDINNRIQKFSSTGTYLAQWGTQGGGNGQFSGALGVAVDQSSGNVYVTDNDGSFSYTRVQRFSSTGTYANEWTISYGAGSGGGVAVDASGNVYLSSSEYRFSGGSSFWDGRVYKFTSTGAPVTDWSIPSGSSGSIGELGVAVDQSSGNVYVTDNENDRVVKSDSTGTNLAQWGTGPNADGKLKSPHGVAVNQSSGDVYVADTGNNRIQRFSSTGTYLGKWGTNGTGNGVLEGVDHVAVNSTSGDVYATDQGGDLVQRFSSTGTYLGQWGTNGTGNGEFHSANGMAVDASGNVYVADGFNDRVQKFSSIGTYLGQWGTTGTGNGQFDGPVEIAVDPSTGNVYVAEAGSYRVQKFTSTGTYLSQWDSGEGGGGMAVDASGNVYVVDLYAPRVRKFSSTGTLLTLWGSYGSANGQFQYPNGVAVGPSGNVYVADGGNNRIQRFG